MPQFKCRFTGASVSLARNFHSTVRRRRLLKIVADLPFYQANAVDSGTYVGAFFCWSCVQLGRHF